MKLPRLTFMLIVAVCLTTVIAVVAPQQLPVTLYKLSLITIAGVAGYWLDRELFPYARPDRFQNDPLWEFAFVLTQLRRALVVAACIVGVGLGA